MRPTRASLLVTVVIVFGAVTWVVLRGSYGSLPTLPWTILPTLLVLALAEFYSGMNIKARIDHRAQTRPIEPIAVARMAALGKASAYAGAGVAGVLIGFVIHVGGSLSMSAARHDAVVAGSTLAAAAALVAAALYLEYCCRVPKGPDDDHAEEDMEDPAHGR